MAEFLPEDYQKLLQILEENKKELSRLQSLDRHTATHELGDYIFVYIEENGKCKVRIYGGGANGIEEHPTKLLSKQALETWAVCWLHDNG